MIQSNNVDATIFDEAKGEYFENAYVAFLDILGFKSIVNNNAIPIIVEIINSIIKNAYYSEWAIHYATYRGDRKSKYAKFNQCLRNSKIYSFSDSIIVVVPRYNEYAISVIIKICRYIQEEMLGTDNMPILLRGAVSQGEIYASTNMVCGKALVEAYNVEEKLSIYPRIIISDKVLSSGDWWVNEEDNGLIHQDKDDFYYIDAYKNLKQEVISNLTLYISEQLQEYVDYRIREKLIWVRKEISRSNSEDLDTPLG